MIKIEKNNEKEIKTSPDSVESEDLFSNTDLNKLSEETTAPASSPEEERKIETIRDLQSMSVPDLIKLEDEFEGVLLYAFTDISNKNEKIDLSNWKTPKAPEAGTKLTVNFLGNYAAEWDVGAADILHPSIRNISVYTNGDPNRSRTSNQRVGLKGRNKKGNGFFDTGGYIPIFSNDVIIIGEPDEEFAKEFGGPLTDELYSKYDKKYAKKDQSFMSALPPEAPISKPNISQDQVLSLTEKMRTSPVGNRVARIAKIFAEKKLYKPKHCWNWAETVFKYARAKRGHSVYNYKKDRGGYVGRYCGDRHAKPHHIAQMAPGDWIYYNNHNTSSAHGNHSAIFLGWENKSRLIGKVASGSSSNRGKIHKVNFRKYPITHIAKTREI